MYSLREAASKLGISERHRRLLLQSGKVEGNKLAHNVVIISLDYTLGKTKRE